MRSPRRIVALLIAALGAAAPGFPAAGQTGDEDRVAKVYGYEIVATYPHDTGAYTQGLLWGDGHLIESTGRLGESSLRRVELATGKVLQSVRLADDEFGEGLARWKDVYIQLTWTKGQAIVRDVESFRELRRFEYAGQGWGLALAGDELVMSNGSSRLQIRDPESFELRRELPVTIWHPRRGERVPVNLLNELEWIDGEIWANVYHTESIVRIDPESGHVTSWIDFTGLQAKQRLKDRFQDVLNGIAHDPKTGRIFITGKYWPNLYEIRLVEPE